MENKDYSQTNPKATFYACLYPELRQIAIKHGYALAIHGSMARDLDLIAVAWTENPSHYEVMFEEMAKQIGGTIFELNAPHKEVSKPHGRICYTLSILGDWFIDLSIIPPRDGGF